MTETPEAHEGFTRMLFVDAIVGVGFPHREVGAAAARDGLALFIGHHNHEAWAWSRTALNDMSLENLQELYISLKTHEVTHAPKH